MTRPRARSTASSSNVRCPSCSLRYGSAIASAEAYSRVDEVMISSMIFNPLARRVEPVEVLSMIRSASSGGNTSVAPKVCSTVASIPFCLTQRLAMLGYSDAITSGRLGKSPLPSFSNSCGAATTSRTGFMPVSNSSGSSTPISSSQSAPAKPTSRALASSIVITLRGLSIFAL